MDILENDELKPTAKRLVYSLILFVSIYGFSLYVFPALPFIRRLIWKFPFLDAGILSQISFLGCSMLFILVPGRRRFQHFGFKRVTKPVLARAVVIGLVFSGAVILVGMILVSVITFGESGPPGGESGTEPVRGLLYGFLAVLIFASICEEIFYRGILLTYLQPFREIGIRIRSVFLSLPVILSGAAFGLGHLCLLSMMPLFMVVQIVISAFICGLVAGYYRERTGSLLPAVLIHMSFNFTGMLIPRMLSAVFAA